MPRFAANLSMMFQEVPFLDRFAAARAAGFFGVEFLFPYDFPKQDIADRLRQAGLSQALFNSVPGDWSKPERGLACLPGREDEFQAGVDKALEYAAALGCPTVHCMAGLRPGWRYVLENGTISTLLSLIAVQVLHCCAILAPNQDVAFMLSIVWTAIQLLMSNFFITFTDVVFQWLTVLRWLSALYYAFEGLSVTEFGGMTYNACVYSVPGLGRLVKCAA